MAVVFRWLLRIAGGLIFISLAVIVVAYYVLSRSLPDYDKQMTVPGISAPVEIVRDNANVPHIFGQSDTDTFFGLGYAHAQDRLWQMTMLRRTAQGRLSEVFGQRTLKVDKVIRRLDLYSLARSSVEVQDDRTQAALEAYAAGVNIRLAEVNTASLGRGAPEMFLFNAPYAPWQPADSIAIIKLMGVQLSSHLENEVLYARASLALEDALRIDDIMPLAPGEGVADLPEYSALFPDAAAWARYVQADQIEPHPLSPFSKRAFAGASNAWAAAPARSAAGGTLLANDPHLGFSAPGIWYLARFDLQSGGVIGGTIPGVSGGVDWGAVLIWAGVSRHLTWMIRIFISKS